MLEQVHLLWREVGALLLVGCLFKILLLVRPAVTVNYLYMSIFIDEDVVRAHISDLPTHRRKVATRLHQSVQQVPKLLLVEVLLHLNTVRKLLAKQVRVVFVL